MNDVSIEAGDPDSPDRATSSGDLQEGAASGPGIEGFKGCGLVVR